MKFYALVLYLHLPQNFCHTQIDTQTDRHFPEIVKSCSGHPKTCESIKNRKLKIFTKPVLFSIYTEESKNFISYLSCMMYILYLNEFSALVFIYNFRS